jgi:hypothetical protein
VIASLSDFFANLPADDFWIWAVVLSGATLGGFYSGFRYLYRVRIIEDTPTARIRSAHQGYVELEGNAELMEGIPIVSPLSNTECCWWRYQIHKKDHKGNWELEEKKTSTELFLLRDDTGVCIIDPEGAEVSPKQKEVWYGSPQPGASSQIGGNFLASRRYTEEYIYDGNHLYAIGLFKSLDDMDHQRARSEIARELLREWKQQPEKMQLFDRNGDGDINSREWEAARRTANTQAEREYREEQERLIPHMLSKPDSRRHPFLISPRPQFDLVKRYRWIAGFSIAGFFVAGALATLMLTARLFS